MRHRHPHNLRQPRARPDPPRPGRYFIEDKQSRNGTFVNSQAISNRTPLKHNDRIRICDAQFVFLDGDQGYNGDEEETDNTTVEAVLSQSSHMILQDQPAERLRGLLEISGSLSKTLQLDLLFPKIGDSLFTCSARPTAVSSSSRRTTARS